jgi:hypothetical protein
MIISSRRDRAIVEAIRIVETARTMQRYYRWVKSSPPKVHEWCTIVETFARVFDWLPGLDVHFSDRLPSGALAGLV